MRMVVHVHPHSCKHTVKSHVAHIPTWCEALCWVRRHRHAGQEGSLQQSGSTSRVKPANKDLINSRQSKGRGQSQCSSAHFIHIISNTNVITLVTKQFTSKYFIMRVNQYSSCIDNIKWHSRNECSGEIFSMVCFERNFNIVLKHMISEVHSVNILYIYFKQHISGTLELLLGIPPTFQEIPNLYSFCLITSKLPQGGQDASFPSASFLFTSTCRSKQIKTGNCLLLLPKLNITMHVP